MTESNFLKNYDNRMLKDLAFVRSFRNFSFLFHNKQKRIWYRSWYWGCWLRYHRWLRLKQPMAYIFRVVNTRDSKEIRGFDFINKKDNEK